MHGNVLEWGQDIYGAEAYQKHGGRNPIYKGSGADRVLRGDSWSVNARYARCAYRGRNDADLRNFYLGLRVVAAPPPGP